MYTKEINSGVFFRDYISGSTDTNYTLQYETAELFICNDGTGAINIQFGFANGYKTIAILAGEQISLPINVPNISTGLTLNITASTAYRIFISGV